MITAWACVTGIIRAGFTVMLLSPRNAPPALAHLLKSTGCRALVHSADKFVEGALKETLALLRKSGDAPMTLIKLPEYSETYGRKGNVQPLSQNLNVHLDDIALISHTSGTSSNVSSKSSHFNFKIRIDLLSETPKSFASHFLAVLFLFPYVRHPHSKPASYTANRLSKPRCLYKDACHT